MSKEVEEGGMELQAFISGTLQAIINGVHEAQKATTGQGHDAIINPTYDHNTHAAPKDVEFDIAVTVTGGSTLGGKSGLSLKVPFVQVGAGLEGQSSESDSKTSRVRFKVPLSMPSTKLPKAPAVQHDISRSIA